MGVGGGGAGGGFNLKAQQEGHSNTNSNRLVPGVLHWTLGFLLPLKYPEEYFNRSIIQS